MNEHKQEIIETRKGCLGSSDGKLLLRVAQLGEVPKSEYKRLAELRGLIEHTDIPQTDAIAFGDFIEYSIYKSLKATDDRYLSNPMLESKKYSRKNVKLISHIDFMLKDDASKTLYLYECKATKYSFEQTRQTYKGQLFVHWSLGCELADELGKGWKVKLFLAHFNTDGLDLSQGCDFDPERLTVRQVRVGTLFNLSNTMDIIDRFLERMDFYSEDDVIDAELLPTEVYKQFSDVAKFLREINEREAKVEEFKKKLYDFLCEKGISKVKCDDFSFAVVAPTQQVTFDYKEYLSDIESLHPRIAKKIKLKYKKTTQRNGYVKISVK